MKTNKNENRYTRDNITPHKPFALNCFVHKKNFCLYKVSLISNVQYDQLRVYKLILIFEFSELKSINLISSKKK